MRGLKRFENVAGQRFNGIEAIRYLRTDKSRCAVWEWKCDCGSRFEARMSSVKAGEIQSCGCLHRNNSSIRALKQRLPKGQAAARELFGTYRRSAKKRSHAFLITLEQFLELTAQRCHYCGFLPSNYTKFSKTNGDYVYNGLDRVDNTIGYELSNLVPCCRQCNIAKRDLLLSDFLAWIKRLTQHQSM